MSKPTRRAVDYEKVDCGDFISGIIEEVQEDMEHKFKKFQNPQEEETFPAVRFKFKLEGYEHPHYSRWQKFTYGEKSNLYLKYLLHLVEGAKPDIDFDVQELTGMEVKTLWSEKNDFQSVETVRPLKGKLMPKGTPPVSEGEQVTSEDLSGEETEDVPF